MYSKCLTMLKLVLLYLFIIKEMNSISGRLPFRSLFKFKYLDIVYMSVHMLPFAFSNVYYPYTCMYCNYFLNKYCLNQDCIFVHVYIIFMCYFLSLICLQAKIQVNIINFCHIGKSWV